MSAAPSGAYQLAKTVAARIAERPGATARELYRLFGTGFAEFGCDGSSASAMIAQHLSKFESEGLVVSERVGKRPNDPRKWTWVGPAPAQTVEEEEITAPQAEQIVPAEQEPPPAVSEHSGDVAEQRPVITVTAIPSSFIALDPADELDRALITVRQTARAMARPPIARRDEKIACLERLAEITAPDIAGLLREIAEDIR